MRESPLRTKEPVSSSMSWFQERLYPYFTQAHKVGPPLVCQKTRFQDLEIIHSPLFGNILLLDGVVQTTENDEFVYHEMLTHIPMLTHPSPRRVLIVGAGDGGVLREVLKYKSVERVVMVEIDGEVIELCRRYLPKISCGAFDDPRAEVVIDDGAAYVAKTEERFDVVIVDSPDPIGPAKILFSKKFYKDILNCLTSKGIMSRQSGSPVLQTEEFRENCSIARSVFPKTFVYLAAIPTYLGGFFSFILGSKGADPKKVKRNTVRERYKNLKPKTRYYQPDLHFASFVLPNFIKDLTVKGGQ